jgi:hypothetical protein
MTLRLEWSSVRERLVSWKSEHSDSGERIEFLLHPFEFHLTEKKLE